jgi:hypothetical protein
MSHQTTAKEGLELIDGVLRTKVGTLSDHDVLGLMDVKPGSKWAFSSFVDTLIENVCYDDMWADETLTLSDGRKMTWRTLGARLWTAMKMHDALMEKREPYQ